MIHLYSRADFDTYYSVKPAILIALWSPLRILALTGAELTKILRCPRCYICKQFHFNTAQKFSCHGRLVNQFIIYFACSLGLLPMVVILWVGGKRGQNSMNRNIEGINWYLPPNDISKKTTGFGCPWGLEGAVASILRLRIMAGMFNLLQLVVVSFWLKFTAPSPSSGGWLESRPR